ncbi:tannase/feruloyl esterase family alpha/beta hydrolase [Porticoccaceae bacterium]|nr:tannase/feruloyl esterase family alpha/beta hydrolase [Porticoccaceae bacterium]
MINNLIKTNMKLNEWEPWRFLFTVGLLGTTLFSVVAVNASSVNNKNCESLRERDFRGTQVLVAEAIPAGVFKAPNGESYEVPAFCRVRGLARTSATSNVIFETWLPEKIIWNGRYHQWDSGGVQAAITYTGLAWRLNKGDAVTEVDALGTWEGNKSKRNKDPMAYLRDSEKVMDLTRGHQVAAKRAKAITTVYYQRAPHHAYFSGCSGGGWSALMEAQRNPDSWDGILAGAAANYALRILLGSFSWIEHLWRDEAGRIPPEKLPTIQQTALSSCSAEAHVINGIAADPRFCRYQPEVLTCQNQETNSCLTQKQVNTLKDIYQGPRYSDGTQIYPGYPSTLETAQVMWNLDGSLNEAGWVNMITGGGLGGEDKPPNSSNAFKWIYQNLIKEGAPWSMESFNLERDYPRALTKKIAGQHLTSLLEAADPNLSAFQDSGGKLLMYNGWGDANQPPEGGIDYVEQVTQRMGGPQKLQSFMRFYMVPGMAHCAGGPGANAFGQYAFAQGGHKYYSQPLQDDAEHDIIKALETWVEKEEAPKKIIATKYINDQPKNGVAFTRPLCVYPKVRVYNGKGDINKASSFNCQVGKTP